MPVQFFLDVFFCAGLATLSVGLLAGCAFWVALIIKAIREICR